MPLPERNTPWPPQSMARVTQSMARWSAWYSGDPSDLASAYGQHVPYGENPNNPRFLTGQQQSAGLRRMLQRLWWGRPINLSESRRDMLHVPLAADICQASADLLFADPAKFTIPTGTESGSSATQDRLNDLTDDGFFSTLAEGAEVGAALGGVYLRVAWDKSIMSDRPFATIVHADAAVPTFMWGHLVMVTFWTEIAIEANVVWRHLEHHEKNTDGNGFILHGLYKGNRENLGEPVGLNQRPETAGLTPTVDTMSPGLAVEYIPNQRPQRRWRNLPAGAYLGRSDLDGVEGLMDALDETVSSLMRDVRLGKARLMLPRDMLHDNGAGRGQTFDAEQEIYAAVSAPADVENLKMLLVQPDIRVSEHQQTMQLLIEQILRTAGYSSQTFGEGEAQGTRTATEIENKEQRSLLTRDRKIRLWRPGISSFLEKLLAVDVAVFGTKITPARPEVDFPPAVQDSQLNIAQTVQALMAAEAASLQTRVEMVHPDWTPDQVTAEVALIQAEKPSMPDPAGFDDPTDPNEPSDPTGGQ